MSDPAYEALANSIRLLSIDNRIAPGTGLPAERELSAHLGVSRTTVAAAYQSLRESGHIESLRGSGSVTRSLPGREAATMWASAGTIDLSQASPAAWPGLAEVFSDAAASVASLLGRSGYDVVGAPELRRAIAARYTAAGIPTSESEILITNGAQSAIFLIASVAVGRGDRVAMETPTYPHAADAMRRAGARVIGIPVSTVSGWDLDRAEQVFRRTLPTLAYLMPDFHNPTGMSMSHEARRVFEESAARAGTILVVDETTAELNIDRAGHYRPLGHGDWVDAQNVVRIGSFGKTVWGGLRIGWVRAQSDFIRRLVIARFAHELGTPEFEQSVGVRLLERMPQIIAQRADVMQKSRDTLVSALSSTLPQWRVPDTHGGVSLWVELDAPLSGPLAMAARSQGLILSSGSRFSLEGGHERHLRIPFTSSPSDLERAVDILASQWGAVRAGAPHVMSATVESVV